MNSVSTYNYYLKIQFSTSNFVIQIPLIRIIISITNYKIPNILFAIKNAILIGIVY